MKKIRIGLLVFLIVFGLLFAGCDSPVVRNILGDLLGDSGLDIKSGDSGSAKISFNSDVEKVVKEWGVIGEEEQGLGYYEFVDEDLKDEPVEGYTIEEDEDGIYVMYRPDAVAVFLGYKYKEGPKKGQFVDLNAFELEGEEGNYWVTDGIGEYYQVIGYYVYADGLKKGQEIPEDAEVINPESDAPYIMEWNGNYVPKITHYVYTDHPDQIVDESVYTIQGPEGEEYVEKGTGAYYQVFDYYVFAEGENAGVQIPEGTATVEIDGVMYAEIGTETYKQIFTGYKYAEGPKEGVSVPEDADIQDPDGSPYVIEGTGVFNQVPTGDFEYQDGTLVVGKEIIEEDEGYFVFEETLVDWIPADIISLTIPNGDKDFNPAVNTFKIDGVSTDYNLELKKSGANTNIISRPDPEIVQIWYYIGDNLPADPKNWTFLAAGATSLNGSKNGAKLAIYAEIEQETDVFAQVYQVMEDGEEITVKYNVTAVYIDGAEIMDYFLLEEVTKPGPIEITEEVPVTAVWGDSDEKIILPVFVTAFMVDGEEKTGHLRVVAKYEMVGGEEEERRAVRELTAICEVQGYKDVAVITEELHQDFTLEVNATEIGSVDFLVDPDNETLTISFKINELILKVLEPQVTCAWSKDENHVFEAYEFVLLENLEMVIPYTPGEVVYIEANYLFQNLGL